MPGSVNNGTVRILAQAFLRLGDTALAVRVVSDVIAESARWPRRGSAGEDDVRHRLAESVFRRCQQLASDPPGRASRPVPPSGDVAGRAGPGGSLSEQERGALGLVLTGGLGHVRASRVLGICPRDMRPSCARHCSGWGPHRPPLPKQQRKQEKDDAETRIRHGDHHGSCRSRARGDGGQVAAGCAAVHGDEENVTRAATRLLAASRPRVAVTVTMSGAMNGTPTPG
jgi:hypothetical protein